MERSTILKMKKTTENIEHNVSAERSAFTLVEMMVTIAIIGVLVAILIPSIGAARESARMSACAGQLKGFGAAFEMYATEDRSERLCSGAFDHLLDGDVRKWGWVSDVIKMNVGRPGAMLCPTNPVHVSRTVAEFTGAAAFGEANPNRPHGTPIVPTGIQSVEFWATGYNTNYTATWALVRGDPSADDRFDNDGDESDPMRGPRDGDGPLDRFLLQNLASPGQLALMGDGRAASDMRACLDATMAATINTFAGQSVCGSGEMLAESFTQGMVVDYSGVAEKGVMRGHDFSDIAPLHHTRSGVGGEANVLFADGHVEAIRDSGGVDGDPDGFIGPYRTGSGKAEINASAYAEIKDQLYVNRMRRPWK